MRAPAGRREGEGLDLEVAAALRLPEAYPHSCATVEVFETHISLVFCAGERAYKIKKAVRFPFLDYSTLARRRHFCQEEVRLNRRLAPEIYLGVAPITADLRIRGTGDVVEYAVEMLRLPQARMLPALLDTGAATAADMDRIAAVLADFHARAEAADSHGSPKQVRARLFATLDDADPFLPHAWRDRLAADYERLLAAHGPLLEERRATGRVRDGHGDLHAGNVCLPPAGPVLYDCIEFEPAFRCGDVAGEVAFLAMDLERRGARERAREFVDCYVARSGDADVTRLLPLFQRYCACVRGLAESLRDPARPAAREYFRHAVAYGLGPCLVVFCGLPGTGKSHAARAVARAFDAEMLRSDLVRKELTGMAPTEHWRGGVLQGPYDPAVTDKTYTALRVRAGELLAAGRRVVVDATCGQRRQRELFRDLQPCLVVWVDCPEDVVRERLARRAGDGTAVSDADFSVYRHARERFEEPRAPDLRHDGRDPPAQLLDTVASALA